MVKIRSKTGCIWIIIYTFKSLAHSNAEENQRAPKNNV